jgi:hypothetical protein
MVDLAVCLSGSALLMVMHWRFGADDITRCDQRLGPWRRVALYYLILMAILLFGRFDQREFIYFQF